VADSGYHFVNWSDASTTNPRTDVNVTADISVTANFAADTGGGGGSGGGGGGVISGPLAIGVTAIVPALPSTGSAPQSTAASSNGTSCTYPSAVENPDITGDGIVDVLDFNALMVAWGTTGVQAADINHDCTVDILDFNALMVGWAL
jgi:uncharacterized repeat protein (TIGR02543 family)